MVKIIVGNKGAGKTKKIIDMINKAVENETGSVVCIEKGMKLTYDISHRCRLVDAEEFGISGYDMFFGFVSGLCAGNYDISRVYIDGILKIGGRNYDALGAFFEKMEKLSEQAKAEFLFTVSADAEELPASVTKYLLD